MMRTRIHALAALLLCATTVSAGVPGFVEDFNGGNTATFGGGSVLAHVPSGGVGGAQDGYLSVATEELGSLATRTMSSNFTGNLPATGVTGYSFWLINLNPEEPAQIRVGVGNGGMNFWVSNAIFTPQFGVWTQYTVDVTSAALWSQDSGAGTFESAIASSNRLLFRHDFGDIGGDPTDAASFGLDRITVLPEPGTIALLAMAGITFIRRRRD